LARALPQTPLRELTELPQTLYLNLRGLFQRRMGGGKGRGEGKERA